MTHFVNECPNLVPKDSDRESDGARSISLTLPLMKKGGLKSKVKICDMLN